jgi:hypothetical protein
MNCHSTVGDFSTFVDGFEGLEIEEFDASTSTGGVTDGLDDRRVNSILVLGTGSVGSEENDFLCGERSISLDSVVVDGQFVGSKCAGLV